ASLDTDPAKLRADCESALGLSLETDLLDLVQPQVVLSSEAVRGIAAPGVRAVARVSDPPRFEASLTAVLGHLAARFPGQLETSARPYRGSPYWTVDFRDEVLGFVQPSFGLVGDRLFVGLKGTHVKRELKRFAAGETESHALQSPDLPWGDAVTGVWYVDWGALFDGLYGTVKTFGGLAASMGDQEMPVDFASLPDAAIVTRHLQATLAITRRVEGGTLTRCESSFGPEIPVALVLAGASAALLAPASVAPDPPEPLVWEGPVEFEPEGPTDGEIPPPLPDDADARAATRDALIRVRTGLQVFHYDQGGRYPDALERLLEPSADFPEGFLGGGALPVDAWGRALRYRPAADGSAYELWSTGANGVDEEGAGDDVRL
ncbi:MAG TPA: type II secretion system protein GspG, partial [Planctomycetota bacterium]|nr:type II secretion system protein GspG [Planctomycetota bacterium]